MLYDDYIPVYVGKADKQSIGYRLQSHRESARKGPRWDRFSWFGLNRINLSGDLGALKGSFSVKTSELIRTLEAMLIVIADPRLNARRETMPGALKISQSDKGKPLTDLEEQFAALHKKLDALKPR